MFSPAHCSLYLLCSQERERKKNSFLFFSFSLQHFQSRNRDLENECMELKGERGRVGGIGRLGLTHKHFGYCVQNRQLMGTYCITQRTPLEAPKVVS